METIRFRDVTFSYPLSERPAMEEVNLVVQPSEFVVVCGKSGCGKTTLLRHMKKNLIPYGRMEGSVTYEGTEIQEMEDRQNAAEIGFVQQNPDSQIVTDKVWHELAFGLESLGMDNGTIKRRVAEMANYFGIQTWFRKDVSQLSGGQKQLLNLASIMAMQPKLLVLDEPTSQLDPIAASDFLGTIYKINRELGTTIILSEHRLEEVFTMADKVLVMDRGHVVAYDAPQRIGRVLAGSGEGERHPMFYGLPSVTKIVHSVESTQEQETSAITKDSPLTIREGRIWLAEKMQAAGREPVGQAHLWETAGKGDAANLPKGNRNQLETAKTEKQERAIHMDNVWFRYDKKSQDVLRGLSLDVTPGQLYCILGGNGAGKSTMLKALVGVVKPQRGKIQIQGRLAMLPQNPQALFTEICVEDELMEALHDEPGSAEEKVEKVVGMLQLMEIEHLREAHPYDLSGGEQQRLALGKVLLVDPDVILLDEVTKGLDPFFKLTLAGILKKLTEQGKTLFMVSHDMEFCAEHGDTCAMFFDGGLVSQGPPEKFFPGNNFYTTTANRMARDYFPKAITWEEVAECVRTSI